MVVVGNRRQESRRQLVEQADCGQKLVALSAQLGPVVLKASQDDHVALSKEFLAELGGVGCAGVIATIAVVLRLARRAGAQDGDRK